MFGAQDGLQREESHPVSFWQGVSPPGTLSHWIEWGASFLRGDCLIVLQASASGLTCPGVCVYLSPRVASQEVTGVPNTEA